MFGGRSTGLIYASNLETRKTLKPTKESVKKAIMTDEAEKPAE
jgi:hypothetical protein